MPYITNLRLDPFERTGIANNGTKEGSEYYFSNWFVYEFWRFVFVQQMMAKEIQTFLEYPPMQRGASFNLDAVKAEMAKRMAEAEAAMRRGKTGPVHGTGAESLGLRVGESVVHAKWGEGVVIDVSGEGERAEAKVRFPSVGEKHLALALAPIKRA